MVELILFLAILGFLLIGINGKRLRASRRTWPPKRRGRRAAWSVRERPSGGNLQAVPGFDAADQLRCVMAASFAKRRLLSKAEARVLVAAERAVREADQGWRVMAQVCLGEILSSPDTEAYQAINSKRVDLLIIARNGEPLAAIEYQGAGHHQGNAAARDAVKKEALRRAGVDYIEVKAGDRVEDLDRAIARLAEREPGRRAAAG